MEIENINNKLANMTVWRISHCNKREKSKIALYKREHGYE